MKPSRLAVITGVLFSMCSLHADFDLSKIAYTSMTAPGQAATFRSFGTPLTHSGAVVFYATNNPDGSGIYMHVSGTNAMIADNNTAVPGGGGNFKGFDPGAYCIENGRVAFVGYFGTTNEGLFVWNNGVLTRVAATGETIPGSSRTYTIFGQPDFDSGDIVAFVGSTNNYRGAYRFSGGNAVKLFDRTDLYPGTSSNLFFSSQLSAENGKVAFWASDGVAASRNAILIYANGSYGLHVSTNDIAPGLEQKFKDFNSPPDLEFGQIGIVASLQAPKGIYLRNVDGGPITRVVDTTVTPPGNNALSGFTTLAIAGTNRAFVLANGNIQGIYLWDNGAIMRVVDTTSKFAQKSVASFGYDMGPGSYADGVLTFKARHFGTDQTIYAVTETPTVPASVTTVATTTNAVPGGTGNFSPLSTAPVLYQNGFVFYGTGPGGQGGMYFSSNGVFHVLVDTNTPLPGRPGNFIAASPAAISGDSLLFQGYGASSYLGLFEYKNGVITRVVDNSAPAADTGRYFTFISNIIKRDDGIYFLGSATNSYAGIFRYNAGTLTRLLDTTSNQFPGTTSNLFVTTFDYQNGNLVMVARPGTDFSTNAVLLWTNNTFAGLMGTNLRDPADTNNIAQSFQGIAIHGNHVYVAAGVASTIGVFSGSTVIRAALNGSSLEAAISYQTDFPGMIDGPQGPNAINIAGSDGQGTLYLTATDGATRGLYRWKDGVVSRYIDNSQLVNGSYLSLFNVTSSSFGPAGAAFSAFPQGGSYGVYAVVTPGPQLQLKTLREAAFAGNVFSATFVGEPGTAYQIQYSTNLQTWLPLTNFVYASPVSVTDLNATNAQRFYRGIKP